MNQSMDRNKINAQNNGIDHNIYGKNIVSQI